MNKPAASHTSPFDAIISDIDGCLGPESNAPLDAHALAQLASHNRDAIGQSRGPILTVCSGRPHGFAEAMCRFLGNDAIPCVCENGVWLYDPRPNAPAGHYIRDPSITPDHLEAVHQATRWIELELVPNGVVIQPGKTASISLWHQSTPHLLSLIPRIRERFAAETWPFRVSNTVAWINCDLAHISKASGIARLKQITGHTTGRLAGIGDTTSDLAIRQHVAFFGCPHNAAPELQAHADYTSPHPEIRGVLDILARIMAMK
jgi:hydroxymethylpyrimidine pyrophosphatase-like HAD family hydrolase